MSESSMPLRQRRLAHLWPKTMISLGIVLSFGWAALLIWLLSLRVRQFCLNARLPVAAPCLARIDHQAAVLVAQSHLPFRGSTEPSGHLSPCTTRSRARSMAPK